MSTNNELELACQQTIRQKYSTQVLRNLLTVQWSTVISFVINLTILEHILKNAIENESASY